ncbi:unnamed protein product [Sympodiomycopsis kandeliae]
MATAEAGPTQASGSGSTDRIHTTADNTSRKGGVAHHIREWHSVPSDSLTDPSQLSPDRVSHRSIAISTWTVTTSRGAIGNSAYMDKLGEDLEIPPPEMVFPSNRLQVRHEPSGFEYTFRVEEALRCVDGVREQHRKSGLDLSADWRGDAQPHRRANLGEKPKKKGKGIKVAYADEWGKSRNDPSSNPAVVTPQASSSTQTQESSPSSTTPQTAFGAAAATQIADARDYDWTFSTTWAGSATTSDTTPSFQPGTDPSVDRIPVERLGPSSGEPILFYDDLVLFEDELGDNGSSMLGVKVRVMPSGFLILQRFFLRVDDVLFRLFDVRVYCNFNEASTSGTARPPHTTNLDSLSLGATTARPPPPSAALTGGISLGATRRSMNEAPSQPPSPQRLIRECSGCEAAYKDVKQKLPAYRPNDLSLLTDPNWVSQTLQTITAKQFQQMNTVLPATFPSSTSTHNGGGSGVLGEVDDEVWSGVGQRVDIVKFE